MTTRCHFASAEIRGSDIAKSRVTARLRRVIETMESM